MKILICFGTRPEAVKMAPLCAALKRRKLTFKICVTAQHRGMLDQVLNFFDLQPDYDLDLMQEDQSLNTLTSRIFAEIDAVFEDFKPDTVLVQGDTTTATAISMAAYYKRIKVGHIEAGLRTNNKNAPFPEEVNRQMISRIADYHFAPTKVAAENLIKENIPLENILITGNTVVDALEMALTKIAKEPVKGLEVIQEKLDPSKKLILVTGHRRENFGTGLKNVCEALLKLSQDEGVQIIYPVHFNPNVRQPVYGVLGNKPDIFLLDPVSYPVFIWLMKQASIIISDSGGIQEEAPTLKKPVLITRDFTERTEGVKKGFSFLVGTGKEQILDKTREILRNPPDYKNSLNPYGDGQASKRILDFLLTLQ